MRDTYHCPNCQVLCWAGTPHMCGPNSLAAVYPTPLGATSGMVEARKAIERALTGPTSGGIARQLSPVILGAIVAGEIPGVTFTPSKNGSAK